jgi:hypothetical protein
MRGLIRLESVRRSAVNVLFFQTGRERALVYEL